MKNFKYKDNCPGEEIRDLSVFPKMLKIFNNDEAAKKGPIFYMKREKECRCFLTDLKGAVI